MEERAKFGQNPADVQQIGEHIAQHMLWHWSRSRYHGTTLSQPNIEPK